MIGPGRPQFVLFGSSVVQQSFSNEGWGAILTDLYDRKADIILRGYSGWNSRRAIQVLDLIFPKEAEVQPSLVIVYFGGNDAVHPHPSGLGVHVPLPEYIENMKKIYRHLKSLSDKIRVIFLTSPPVNEALIHEHFGNLHDHQARTNESCRRYAEALVELSKQSNIKVINLWTAIQQRGDWATTYLTDGIHFTREGSQIVVREILKVIKEADWEPSLFWTSMPTEFGEDSPYYMVQPDGSGKTINASNGISSWKIKWTANNICSKL
ncbi:SGNH hydrolase-type esterase superfamily protein [Perilla frutescens var. frutescens]|nr:SGNH hydrolase-type esterase superfamily protein [Perilla frutescens var. frutescens]